jgi:hypothetical protein
LYRKRSCALTISCAVNAPVPVRAITPRGLMTRRYSFHKGSSGTTLSQGFCVFPYGKSHRIRSMLSAGNRERTSMQSPSISEFASCSGELNRVGTFAVRHAPENRELRPLDVGAVQPTRFGRVPASVGTTKPSKWLNRGVSTDVHV